MQPYNKNQTISIEHASHALVHDVKRQTPELRLTSKNSCDANCD